ncbi:MAG TPA: hypothetical protein VGQ94_04740 [Terriglobales bacterium]|nr:hypothetical protein [Terriglobales bacterium]
MSIVAGFKSHEGIVLCADTQETVGTSKRHVPKLRFEPKEKAGDGVPPDELAVGFCGATNDGVFLDEMVDRAWENVQTATSLDEACDNIKGSIKTYHREAVKLYQAGSVPQTELIYGVKMHRSSRLFYALGPAISERDKYATGGVGAYMADFLASRMYRDYLGLTQCLILATYTLFQAKENVDGCGGDSHIAILREDGASGKVDWHRVEALTDLLKAADRHAGELLLHVADLKSSNEKFRESVGLLVDALEVLRDMKRRDIEQHAGMLRALFVGLGGKEKPTEDEYGFSVASDADKAEQRP